MENLKRLVEATINLESCPSTNGNKTEYIAQEQPGKIVTWVGFIQESACC
jgi:hypothetical protein